MKIFCENLCILHPIFYPCFSVIYGRGVFSLLFLHPQSGNSLIPAAGKCTLKIEYSIGNEPSCNPRLRVRHDPDMGEREHTYGNTGWHPAGKTRRRGRLPTRDSPSVITTVAGHPVKGRISKLRGQTPSVDS